MAFLDNSGDIILDAVLTDLGRERLSRGDGSFNIKFFGLSDDEIDYSLYDKTASTAQADVDILSTPILEAFTDNRASLNSRLITLDRNDILYMPILKLNEQVTTNRTQRMQASHSILGDFSGFFVVPVDENTIDSIDGISNGDIGLINGAVPSNSDTYIRVDQGEVGSERTGIMDYSMTDNSYLIEMDGRLGFVVSPNIVPGSNSITTLAVSYTDDDGIDTYYASIRGDGNLNNTVQQMSDVVDREISPITGRRGTKLQFSIGSRRDLADSNTLFDILGYQKTIGSPSYTFRVIDTSVRVTGITSGRKIDIPVKFIKKV